MNNILKVEVLLNIVNTLLAKACFFKKTKEINDLKSIRYDIYYKKYFNYDLILNYLKKINKKLN